jgi:SpoVK/Ycf46/Vps4 family AAA+-type ATPase
MQFSTIALQLAAHEARQGHPGVANDIRNLVERSKTRQLKVVPLHRDLDDLVIASEPAARMSDIILSDDNRRRIERILREYKQRSKLHKHGMDNRRKLLLAGPPGTGKTLTASVIAGEIAQPLFVVLMDKLVTRFMGETGAKLRQIFNSLRERRGVYLFDEFDAIGAERALDNDVGEMRRVLNAFLQFLENDKSESIIVAASNSPKILDHALFRRFDDVLHYCLPTAAQIYQLIENRLGAFKGMRFPLTSAVKIASKLRHAEITHACDDAIKTAILDDQTEVSKAVFIKTIEDRCTAYNRDAK